MTTPKPPRPKRTPEKVMFPNAIDILGMTYTIHTSTCIEKGEWWEGKVDYLKQEILLDNELSTEKAKSTLIHEIIHAILEEVGIKDENRDSLVQPLAQGLYMVLRNNPELVKCYLERK